MWTLPGGNCRQAKERHVMTKSKAVKSKPEVRDAEAGKPDKAKSEKIAILHVTLDEVVPKVTRRLAVPAGIKLDHLHLALQAALGWTDSHLWEMRVGEASWGIPDPDWPDGPGDARKETLSGVLADVRGKTLHYLYDFGDGWEHTVKVEAFQDAVPGEYYPKLIEASGHCPPEDVGGWPGYEECLAALADPDDERHEEVKEWWPKDFDPNTAPFKELSVKVMALAMKGSRNPRGSR
jgi:hypothetical protein